MGNNCSRSCFSNKNYYQEWPTKGTLKENMNLPLRELKENINTINTDETEIIMYKMTTVDMNDGGFIQTGSGPNFQGDIITLCTCRKDIRTWRTPEQWKKRWVAGFTGINVTKEKKCFLFYLTKVKDAYISQKEIWNQQTEKIVNEKNSRHNTFGDIYQPKPDINDEYDTQEYYKPIIGHPHRKSKYKCEWHDDINYKNKRPSMLVGNPKYSFLWSKPLMLVDSSLNYSRHKIFCTMREFLDNITDE